MPQLCLTLCNPMHRSLPGSSVHGILQARILGWVAISSSRDLPDPGIEPASLMSPAQAGGFFTTGTTWEAHEVHWMHIMYFIKYSLLYIIKHEGMRGEINLCVSQFYSFGENTLKYIHSKYVRSLTTSVSTSGIKLERIEITHYVEISTSKGAISSSQYNFKKLFTSCCNITLSINSALICCFFPWSWKKE